MVEKQEGELDVPVTGDFDGEVGGKPEETQHVGVGGAGSNQVPLLAAEGIATDGEERDFKNLVADILVQVFSYLNQKNLFEVMTVSRHWEKCVREGREL